MFENQLHRRGAIRMNSAVIFWRHRTAGRYAPSSPVAVVDLGNLAPQCGHEMSPSQPTVDKAHREEAKAMSAAHAPTG